MDINQKIQKIAGIARLIYSRHQGYMEHLKSSSKEIERNDFIWHFLLQSFATMGKASGWIGLVGLKRGRRLVEMFIWVLQQWFPAHMLKHRMLLRFTTRTGCQVV